MYDAPLIIAGCPSSGASALASLLSAHPGICILPEAGVYDVRDDYFASKCQLRWEQIPIDLEPYWKEAVEQLLDGRRTNLDVRATLFYGIRRIKPLQVYGDMAYLRYLDQLPRLARQFPGARFVVTIRDGREVVASQIRGYHQRRQNGQAIDWWMRPTISEAQSLWLDA